MAFYTYLANALENICCYGENVEFCYQRNERNKNSSEGWRLAKVIVGCDSCSNSGLKIDTFYDLRPA